jgi:hypothetical protein
MAVHYTLFETGPASNLHVDLFQSNENFYMQNVPAEIVEERRPVANGINSGFVPVKRLSLRFGTLSSNQRNQLNYFIIQHTVSEV